MIRRKLIEIALPLDAINRAATREGFIYRGSPSGVQKWWAQRPLAACRAVLFAQLVDDPSSWPTLFPKEVDQDKERLRLFRLIEELVTWENSDNGVVLDAARLEIARSFARGRIADGQSDGRDQAMVADSVSAKAVLAYLAEVVPPVHDPFAGGGSIPLEAQRLGLRAIGTDLNPVAVLINKALIEIPPKFAGRAPVGPIPPGETQERIGRSWPSCTGLAEDIRRYGIWVFNEAQKRMGHLYPEATMPADEGGGRAPIIAWLWARTVHSPDPAFRGVHVPLVSSFWLSKRKGQETWVEPVVEQSTWKFMVRRGRPKEPKVLGKGTKQGKGTFRCVLSGAPIPAAYIREEAKHGRMGQRLMAIAVGGSRKRTYLPPSKEHEELALSAEPSWIPDEEFAQNSRHMTPCVYGMSTFADLFTRRQLVALNTFSDLIAEVRELVLVSAERVKYPQDSRTLEEGGTGPLAYADAVATYLAMAVDKVAEYSNQLVVWYPLENRPKGVFARQAIPMVWDFAEPNPLSSIGGSWLRSTEIVSQSLSMLNTSVCGRAFQANAVTKMDDVESGTIVSTDPPYYDNVPYADLSDFFYVWLRRNLRRSHPSLFRTLLVPKAEELVADSFRSGSKEKSERFFETGMTQAVARIAASTSIDLPVTIYYAFRQSEKSETGIASTGWDTFLQGILQSGFLIVGTWPIRTERSTRIRDIGSNALASSIVLVCRKRPDTAATITRGQFRRLLRAELPGALRAMEKGSVAPVDLAQASIGPGMAIFSRHAAVLEANDSPMTVRAALQLINEVVDELRGEEEGDLDRETRFAVTWFENRGYEQGPYGEAEVLATARAVSVQSVAEAGICHAAAGKVRLLTRAELPDGWDPASDERLTVWEATQHLIKRLDEQGEGAAGALLARLGDTAEAARVLAYRLYTVCERRGWAEEGRAYNGLVVSWPDLEKLAGDTPTIGKAGLDRQAALF